MIKETFKRQNGITLIALIITIIVLLILVGVSITMLTGENGILTRANEAANLTKYKTAEEKVNLAVIGAMADDGEMIVEELKKEVGYQGGSVIGITFPVQVQMDGYNFAVEETGKVISKGEDENRPVVEITASDIANAEDKSKYYGVEVKGYECEQGEGVNAWKLFYADQNNMYLIADNPIEKAYIPNSTKNGVSTNNNPGKNAYEGLGINFANVLQDYDGSANITDKRIQALNSKYFEYLETENKTSTSWQMQAIAYILDTVAWDKFRGDKAEYAVGAPTIELLLNSYNQKYNTNYQVRSAPEGVRGYQMTDYEGHNWNDQVTLKYSDELYNKKLHTTWIASPTNNSDAYVMYFTQENTSWNPADGGTNALRPVVCLKSDVKIQENKEGTYTIL